jgi:hypothetical protein
LQDQNTIAIVLGHKLEKQLETVRIAVGEFVEKMFTRGWFNQPVQVGRLKRPLNLANWLHPTGGNPPSGERFQAKTTFILAEKPHRPPPSQNGNREERQHR